MKFTPFVINGKPLASLSIGCMRFQNEKETDSVINKCVENGVSYLDTSPSYCFQTEEENCEAWVGRSIKHIREKVILSAKSSPGNGGFKIGDLDISHGFSVNRADDVRRIIEQSLTRMDVSYFDCYQMWSVNNIHVFSEAIKPNGWLDGALKAKSEGLLKHIGITGHADVDAWKVFIDSGYFEMITLPFNMFSADRIPCIKYALSRNIAVLAMNPLGGGLLTIKNDNDFYDLFKRAGVKSISELSLKYCDAYGVSSLSGMACEKEAIENCNAYASPPFTEKQAESYRASMLQSIDSVKFKCTSCGYCSPCPRGINISEVLRLYNWYTVLKLEGAKRKMIDSATWGKGFNFSDCIACGKCEAKCPNNVPVQRYMKEIAKWTV